MAERIDEIGFGGLRLIQEPEEFCYGVDAVILADFAAKNFSVKAEKSTKTPNGETNKIASLCQTAESTSKKKSGCIVDLGTGTGIVPLILSYKTDAAFIAGVELQQASYARAVRNAELNGLSERLSFFNADVKTLFGSGAKPVGSTEKTHETEFYDLTAVNALKGQVDAVTMNPPYMPNLGGLTNANTAKAIARHETTASLWDFFACASSLLKPKGDLFMVHRPSRLADICCFARENRLEPKELCFVSPNVKKAPNIVLVHCVKDGGRELKLLDPLFVYKEDGDYTDELRKCYI